MGDAAQVSSVLGERGPQVFQGTWAPPATTQAQTKGTTCPEAGEGNSGPRIGFLGEGTPILKNWKGVTFSKLPFMTPQVLLKTRMKEKNRPTMP